MQTPEPALSKEVAKFVQALYDQGATATEIEMAIEIKLEIEIEMEIGD